MQNLVTQLPATTAINNMGTTASNAALTYLQLIVTDARAALVADYNQVIMLQQTAQNSLERVQNIPTGCMILTAQDVDVSQFFDISQRTIQPIAYNTTHDIINMDLPIIQNNCANIQTYIETIQSYYVQIQAGITVSNCATLAIASQSLQVQADQIVQSTMKYATECLTTAIQYFIGRGADTIFFFDNLISKTQSWLDKAQGIINTVNSERSIWYVNESNATANPVLNFGTDFVPTGMYTLNVDASVLSFVVKYRDPVTKTVNKTIVAPLFDGTTARQYCISNRLRTDNPDTSTSSDNSTTYTLKGYQTHYNNYYIFVNDRVGIDTINTGNYYIAPNFANNQTYYTSFAKDVNFTTINQDGLNFILANNTKTNTLYIQYNASGTPVNTVNNSVPPPLYDTSAIWQYPQTTPQQCDRDKMLSADFNKFFFQNEAFNVMNQTASWLPNTPNSLSYTYLQIANGDNYFKPTATVTANDGGFFISAYSSSVSRIIATIEGIGYVKQTAYVIEEPYTGQFVVVDPALLNTSTDSTSTSSNSTTSIGTPSDQSRITPRIDPNSLRVEIIVPHMSLNSQDPGLVSDFIYTPVDISKIDLTWLAQAGFQSILISPTALGNTPPWTDTLNISNMNDACATLNTQIPILQGYLNNIKNVMDKFTQIFNSFVLNNSDSSGALYYSETVLHGLVLIQSTGYTLVSTAQSDMRRAVDPIGSSIYLAYATVLAVGGYSKYRLAQNIMNQCMNNISLAREMALQLNNLDWIIGLKWIDGSLMTKAHNDSDNANSEITTTMQLLQDIIDQVIQCETSIDSSQGNGFTQAFKVQGLVCDNYNSILTTESTLQTHAKKAQTYCDAVVADFQSISGTVQFYVGGIIGGGMYRICNSYPDEINPGLHITPAQIINLNTDTMTAIANFVQVINDGINTKYSTAQQQMNTIISNIRSLDNTISGPINDLIITINNDINYIQSSISTINQSLLDIINSYWSAITPPPVDPNADQSLTLPFVVDFNALYQIWLKFIVGYMDPDTNTWVDSLLSISQVFNQTYPDRNAVITNNLANVNQLYSQIPREDLPGGSNNQSNPFSALFAAFSEWWTSMANIFSFIPGFVPWAQKVTSFFTTELNNAIHTIQKGTSDAINAVFIGTWNTFKNVVNSITTGISSVFTGLGNGISNIFTSIIKLFTRK
jgi:hypothetical protein